MKGVVAAEAGAGEEEGGGGGLWADVAGDG